VAYSTRRVMRADAKARIARTVARHIPNDASLFINIGTTTEEVARALVHHKNLRVITNNLNVAVILSDVESCEVTVAGGAVRKRDRGIIGEATLDFIRQFRVDFGVIGISGIEADGTLLDFDYREVQVAKDIISNSRTVFLVADHTKFGRGAMVRLGHVGQIDAVFTDKRPDERFLECLAVADVRVHTP
jgi:DeoR family glycerol-3-phosphate regulon repressor